MPSGPIVRLLPHEQRDNWEQTAVVSMSVENFDPSSRLTPLRSFARDKGFPFHAFFAKVSPTKETPVRATMFTLALTALLSLFNMASNVALATLVSLSLTGLITSYMLTVISILSFRIRGERLPTTHFNLGKPQTEVEPGYWTDAVAGRRLGFVCNTIAFMFLAVVLGESE